MQERRFHAQNPQVEELLRRLNPSETALHEWLQPCMTDDMLWEIAASDYGYKAKEHFQALKRIHRGEPLSVPLDWHPKETLELTRWSEPDDPNWNDNHSKGLTGHLIRAFCCEILLRAGDSAETQEYISGENTTLIQLIASVRYLGKIAEESALRFLSWRALRLPEDNEERFFFALGVLLLCASLFEPPQDGEDLALLAGWIEEEAERATSQGYPFVWSEEWLLGLTNFDQRHEVWRRLSQEILLDAAKGFPESCAATLRDIALRLVPPAPS